MSGNSEMPEHVKRKRMIELLSVEWLDEQPAPEGFSKWFQDADYMDALIEQILRESGGMVNPTFRGGFVEVYSLDVGK